MDAVLHERAKLAQIVRSLEALGPRASLAMWQRAYERIEKLADDESELFYGRPTETTSNLKMRAALVVGCLGDAMIVRDGEVRWRGEAQAIEDEPEDPDAPAAPAPLAEVAPRKGGRPSRHPQAGTPQYKQVRAERPRPSAWDTQSPAVMEWAFGEGEQGEAVFEDTGVTAAPVGRPRRGTSDAEVAARLLLEHCPGRTITELRACLARGKPSASARAIREELPRAVRDIRGQKLARAEALAKALECGVGTVHKLARS